MTNDMDIGMPGESNPMSVQNQQMAEQEKLLSQSEVNTIAGKVRQEAYEKGKKEAESSMAQNRAQGSLTEEQVRQIVMDQTQRAQQEQMQMQQARQIIGDFSSKMAAGADAYPDFEQKVGALDLPKIPEIIQLANSVDNTADVMYELASKPYKVGNLITLARTAPHLAHQEAQRLSASIKANQQAQQNIQTPEPVSQVKPTSAPAENGAMDIKSLRGQKWLRR